MQLSMAPAIDLAPDQPAGHYVLALLESHFFWNWNQADTFSRRAVDLNPSDFITHAWYAIFLGSWPELYEQAIERVRDALGKDPVCFEANLFKAHIEGLDGRTDRTIDGYRRTSELYPKIALPHTFPLSWRLWGGGGGTQVCPPGACFDP